MRNSLPSLSPRPLCPLVSRILLLIPTLLILTNTAHAQMRPVVLKGATLLIGDGRTIEQGSLVMQAGKIASVGKHARAPFLAQKLDLRGKYISPGLVDTCGTFALRDDPSAGRATAHAADALDRYAKEELSAAWANGITTFFIPARASAGFGGLGAVVSPRVAASSETILLLNEAALCVTIGDAGPLARIQTVQQLDERFQAAKDYRRTWEDYEEDLEEYKEKLAKRAKENAKKNETKKDDQDDKKNKTGTTTQSKDQQSGKSGKKKDQDKDNKQDDIEKPTEPEKDPTLETLLRVLDGELRLRIEAHTPADILNVLELAAKYHPALIIEGATGAHLVADQLADARIPVVLTTPPTSLRASPGLARYASADNAAILNRAGVDVYFGSGLLPIGAAPGLTLRAARAVRYGLDVDDLLARLTSHAAKLLGVDDRVGKLANGRRADIVVWSAHPLVPGARVERVYVGGIEVYQADDVQ